MLRNVKDLRGYAIHASDGAVGDVDDLYFDDDGWMIRYFVVKTGHWLSGRQVLISPLAVGEPDWMGRLLPVSLTKAQVEHSPDIDTRKPVSRQHEAVHLRYYGYPYYWNGGGALGLGAYPGGVMPENRIDEASTSSTQTSDDCHLRSCGVVIGHHIHAKDGDIGHVEDFLVDDKTWAIRYLIVDTSNWWGEHHVLVSPQWIEAVCWSDAKVMIDLTRQAVRGAPPYDATAQLDRQQERGMFEHYGRPWYWTPDAPEPGAAPAQPGQR